MARNRSHFLFPRYSGDFLFKQLGDINNYNTKEIFMSLNKTQISNILHMITDITARMIDTVDNGIKLQTSEAHDMRNAMMKEICNIEFDEFMSQRQKSHRLLLKRGDTMTNDEYVGRLGEITMDTETNTLRVHDGETAGGVAMARQSEIPDLSGADYVIEWQNPVAENNYTWYRKYKSGWVEIGGNVKASTTGFVTVELPIPMINTSYCAVAHCLSTYVAASSSSHNYVAGKSVIINRETLTTTSFQAYIETSNDYFNWFVQGQSL